MRVPLGDRDVENRTALSSSGTVTVGYELLFWVSGEREIIPTCQIKGLAHSGVCDRAWCYAQHSLGPCLLLLVCIQSEKVYQFFLFGTYPGHTVSWVRIQSGSKSRIFVFPLDHLSTGLWQVRYRIIVLTVLPKQPKFILHIDIDVVSRTTRDHCLPP